MKPAGKVTVAQASVTITKYEHKTKLPKKLLSKG